MLGCSLGASGWSRLGHPSLCISVFLSCKPCVPSSLHHWKHQGRDFVLLCCRFWEMSEIGITVQTGFQKSEPEAMKGARINARKTVRKIDVK